MIYYERILIASLYKQLSLFICLPCDTEIILFIDFAVINGAT